MMAHASQPVSTSLTCKNAAMSAALADLFQRAGCQGWLCVQTLDGEREITLGADER